MSVWAGDDSFLANVCEMSDIGYLPAFDLQRDADAEFIAAAREMVPELARRLKRACQALRKSANWDNPNAELADELEKPIPSKLP